MFHKKTSTLPPIHKNALSLRIILFIIIGLLFIIVGYTIFFIYTNVYNTIGEVRSILINTQNFGVEVIDFQRLETVSQKWEDKHTSSTSTSIRDPFYTPPEPQPTPQQSGL